MVEHQWLRTGGEWILLSPAAPAARVLAPDNLPG